MFTKFKEKLIAENLSANTIRSYVYSVKSYLNSYEEWSTSNLLQYKDYLIENCKSKTVNLRILAINKYLEFMGKENLKLRMVKTQQKTF